MPLELGSLRSVRACADKVLAGYARIDVLINNAGVFPPDFRPTQDGFETQIGVNHLGHFLLTNLLLDKLATSAPARVVTVSSMMHAGGKIDFASFCNPEKYSAMAAYRQSKLANILFANELGRRLATRGVATEIARDSPLWMRAFMRVAGTTPAKGARTSIFLASSPEVEGVTGEYFVSCKPAKTDPLAGDRALAKRLWDESASLIGLA